MRISDWSSDVCSSDLRLQPQAFLDLVEDQELAAESAPTEFPGRGGCPRLRGDDVMAKAPASGRAMTSLDPFDLRTGVVAVDAQVPGVADDRSEEQTSELQSLMRNSYAVLCLKKKT